MAATQTSIEPVCNQGFDSVQVNIYIYIIYPFKRPHLNGHVSLKMYCLEIMCSAIATTKRVSYVSSLSPSGYSCAHMFILCPQSPSKVKEDTSHMLHQCMEYLPTVVSMFG